MVDPSSDIHTVTNTAAHPTRLSDALRAADGRTWGPIQGRRAHCHATTSDLRNDLTLSATLRVIVSNVTPLAQLGFGSHVEFADKIL